MHRTRAAGVVGLTLLVAACTTAPATTPASTGTVPEPTSGTSAPTPASSDPAPGLGAGSKEAGDGTPPLTEVPTNVDDEAIGQANGATGPVVELTEAPSGQTPTGPEHVEGETTTTTSGANSTADLEELVDEVADVLADLDSILADLDADLAGVQDGLNQNEGDVE